MDIYLARTQGFCAGVSFAIDIVEKAIEKYGLPIYVYHEIVHNTFVVDDFKKRGVVFVETLKEVPAGARIIFSAHGVPPSIVQEAKDRRLQVIDATCPLVKKVHRQATRFSEKGHKIILIGHKGHQEMVGTAGYVNPDNLYIIESKEEIKNLTIDPQEPVAYVTQTTLSVDESKEMIDDLHRRFPNLIEPARDDICYATQHRQDAVKELARICDLIIICGSTNSSNSNRLRETGEMAGVESHIIDSADDLDMSWFDNKSKVGISSGASVPKFIVRDLVYRIQALFPGSKVHHFDNPERHIVFPLPAF